MTKVLRVSDVSAASPDMDNDQFNELVEDIRKHGQLVPIWKSGDEIIDGRKRARACSMLGIPVRAVNMFADMDQAECSRSLNILRTHYTASQRSMFAARMAKATKADGAAIRDNTNTQLGIDKPKTVAEAASAAGVGKSSVIRAKYIAREGAPEVVEAVESGKLTIHSAEQIVKTVAKQNQAAAVKIRQAEPRRSDGSIIGKSKQPKRLPTRPIEDRMERCLTQLENAVELLGEFIREPGAKTHVQRRAWIKRIFKARTAITRIINIHGGQDE